MRVVLGVSGGIAAYKTPDLVRRLRDRGAEVQVILTPNAARFVSPLSLAAVSSRGVIIDQWGDSGSGGVDHIDLARWADLLLIAPATANILAKLAHGIADDALSTYAVAHRTRVAVAPAMNTFMLKHPAVRENILTLQARGVEIVDPDAGELACGDVGEGRMPDPDILASLVLGPRNADLQGLKIVVTAGPTREPIDGVRYLTNRSSGKMGYSIAAAAARRGASVVLVSGPSAVQPPAGVEVRAVMTAAQMRDETVRASEGADVLIGAAAVADFTPAQVSTAKIRRGEGEMTLRLVPTDDILATVSRIQAPPMIVAFAAETEDVLSSARRKLAAKGAELVIANDVSDPTIGFDVDQNRVLIVSSDDVREFGPRPKSEVADEILSAVRERLTRRRSEPALS